MRINSKKALQNVIIFPFISLIWLHSCAINRSNRNNDSGTESSITNPNIIFLNYSIKLDKSKNAVEIRLVDKTIAEGKLKQNVTEAEISRPGDLKCITLDNRMIPLDSIIIPDPLHITVESVSGNNELFRKEITKDSAEFTVRLQFTQKMYAVGIKKSAESKNQNSYLLLTKLR
jgi:hypothetical protein